MTKFFRILDKIFEIAVPVIFLAFGIVAFCFSGYDFEEDFSVGVTILSILLIVQGAAKIADFIGEHKFNEQVNFDIVFGIASIAMGIVFLATKGHLSLDKICTIWGIYEIIEGSFEIQHIIVALKEKEWVAFIELAVALISIVFGILLVISKAEDIKVHLIAVGSVFTLSAIGQVIKNVSEHKKEKK